MTVKRKVWGILCGMVAYLCGAVAQAEFSPITGWEQQLFPSYIIATASMRSNSEAAKAELLGDSLGLLGVQVVAPADNTSIKVTIECPEYFEVSVYKGVLGTSGTAYPIFPKIKYRYDRLAKCDQASPTSVTYRVQLGEDSEEEQTVTLTIRSINDCPFLVGDGDNVIDTSYTFAAYVNEQHPFVDKLLRESLDIGIVQDFSGYLKKDEKEVLRQVYALWDLLVRRDVRYSSITTTAANSNAVASQHVRLIEESVNNSQANCVDGSVLFVSMLRKIGIRAFLVIEPSHCYAGFYSDAAYKHCFALETTLLGQAVPADQVEIPQVLDEAVPAENRSEDTFASFAAAIQMGNKQFTKNKSKFTSEKPGDYRIIDIAAARQQGVLPIAFQNKEGFVWVDHKAAQEKADAANESTDGDSADEPKMESGEAIEGSSEREDSDDEASDDEDYEDEDSEDDSE